MCLAHISLPLILVNLACVIPTWQLHGQVRYWEFNVWAVALHGTVRYAWEGVTSRGDLCGFEPCREPLMHTFIDTERARGVLDGTISMHSEKNQSFSEPANAVA